jgi:hypothetical protein
MRKTLEIHGKCIWKACAGHMNSIWMALKRPFGEQIMSQNNKIKIDKCRVPLRTERYLQPWCRVPLSSERYPALVDFFGCWNTFEMPLKRPLKGHRTTFGTHSKGPWTSFERPSTDPQRTSDRPDDDQWEAIELLWQACFERHSGCIDRIMHMHACEQTQFDGLTCNHWNG